MGKRTGQKKLRTRWDTETLFQCRYQEVAGQETIDNRTEFQLAVAVLVLHTYYKYTKSCKL